MSERREKPCKQPRLPEQLSAITTGYRWARDTVGEAGARVYRLHGKSDAPDLYLSAARRTSPVTSHWKPNASAGLPAICRSRGSSIS